MLFIAMIASAALSAPAQAAADQPVGDCYSQAGCTDRARSARAFTASVGVNTHLGYSDTSYFRNWPLIRDRLIELGVSHVRDGTFPVGYPDVIGPTVAARYNELNAAGIKGNLLVGHEQSMSDGAPTTLAQRLDWIKSEVPAFTIAVEGSNEWDTHGGNAARVQALRDIQCDISTRVRADPALASKLVIGPSSGNGYEDRIWYAEVGDLSGCLDRGNLHPYPGADPPHRRLSKDLSVALDWGRTTYGDKTPWATESGYWNSTSDANDVSEAASGTYVPRLLMEYFRRGIERTQAYELIDIHTGSGRVIDNYGLLRSDGTRKPAFTALRNMLAIVKEPEAGAGAGAASGSLRFGIVCQTNCRTGDPSAFPTQDGPIRHVLLEDSTGAYYLAVWSESKVWDPVTRADTPKPAQGFRLHLHSAPAKLEIFDPASGTEPIRTDTSGSKTVDTTAPDKLRLIKITPAPPSPAPAREAEPTADNSTSCEADCAPTIGIPDSAPDASTDPNSSPAGHQAGHQPQNDSRRAVTARTRSRTARRSLRDCAASGRRRSSNPNAAAARQRRDARRRRARARPSRCKGPRRKAPVRRRAALAITRHA